MPIIQGELDQGVIRVKMRLSIGTVIFMSFGILLLSKIGITMLIDDMTIAFLIIFGMIAIAYSMCTWFFKVEALKASEMLKDLFEG